MGTIHPGYVLGKVIFGVLAAWAFVAMMLLYSNSGTGNEYVTLDRADMEADFVDIACTPIAEVLGDGDLNDAPLDPETGEHMGVYLDEQPRITGVCDAVRASTTTTIVLLAVPATVCGVAALLLPLRRRRFVDDAVADTGSGRVAASNGREPSDITASRSQTVGPESSAARSDGQS